MSGEGTMNNIPESLQVTASDSVSDNTNTNSNTGVATVDDEMLAKRSAIYREQEKRTGGPIPWAYGAV